MASIIRQFTASIPANTQVDDLYSYAIVMPVEQVISIDLEVPPGPSGLMGFYLAMSGVQLIPFEFGQFIVWDDYRDSWSLEGYPESNAWSVVGYNLDDANAHEVIVRFHDNPLAAAAATTPTLNIVNSSTAVAVTL